MAALVGRNGRKLLQEDVRAREASRSDIVNAELGRPNRVKMSVAAPRASCPRRVDLPPGRDTKLNPERFPLARFLPIFL